jgi:hypothetical protein
VADKDGQTCTTCTTLNPPGAPACIRCNSPLPLPAAEAGVATRVVPAAPADPLTGAKRLGPGLAGSGRGTPGSSRSAAVPTQPPGYGLDPPPPPAPPPGPTPADLRRALRRITIAGLLVVLLVLLGGGTVLWLTRPRYVDTSAVATTIGQQLTARLGGPVTVECPGSPRREHGSTFRCTARDTRGGQQTVTVTLVDDTGRYRWELGG